MNRLIDFKQNLHTHSVYCDGKDTPEEMILKAIELGFDTIGFSGHSYMGFDLCWQMSQENTEMYKNEIALLKHKYHDKINVLCGLEFDMYAVDEKKDYDYLIGSCHFVKTDGEIVEFDTDAQGVTEIIRDYYGGNGMEFAKAYYNTLSDIYSYGYFDIIGHFDIVTKHIEKLPLFDISSDEYKKAALEAVYALKDGKGVFEVNTGAISRGYRTTPYPAPFILEEMNRMGCRVTLTSDCHDKKYLDCYYKESLELLRACGFKTVAVWENGRFEDVGI